MMPLLLRRVRDTKAANNVENFHVGDSSMWRNGHLTLFTWRQQLKKAIIKIFFLFRQMQWAARVTARRKNAASNETDREKCKQMKVLSLSWPVVPLCIDIHSHYNVVINSMPAQDGPVNLSKMFCLTFDTSYNAAAQWLMDRARVAKLFKHLSFSLRCPIARKRIISRRRFRKIHINFCINVLFRAVDFIS